MSKNDDSEVKVMYFQAQGRRHRLEWDAPERLVKLTGVEWQSVPAHDGERSGDYRYTHGGEVYQAACDRIWREEDTGKVAIYGIKGGL